MAQIIQRMTLSEFSILWLLLSASVAFSQQVGVVDLTEPGAAPSTASTSVEHLAPGCTQETVGIMANGAVTPNDGHPRKLSVEIVQLSSTTLQVGGEIRAEIRLRNVGEAPIEIPWSKDPSTMKKGPNPDHLEWEQGNLRVVLRVKERHQIVLKSSEQWLLGSQFVAGSQITVKPSEWIEAFLTFKVEDLYNFTSYTEFPIGDAKLFAEWGQARREWSRENCSWNRAWFDYRSY